VTDKELEVMRNLLGALNAMHMCHRAFSSNDNWTMMDDEAREFAEKTMEKTESLLEGHSMTENPRLEVWSGANIAQIRDADQAGFPLVCQVPRAAEETVAQNTERAKMLAEIIELGWKMKYGR
jgi:hypothetical protein